MEEQKEARLVETTRNGWEKFRATYGRGSAGLAFLAFGFVNIILLATGIGTQWLLYNVGSYAFLGLFAVDGLILLLTSGREYTSNQKDATDYMSWMLVSIAVIIMATTQNMPMKDQIVFLVPMGILLLGAIVMFIRTVKKACRPNSPTNDDSREESTGQDTPRSPGHSSLYKPSPANTCEKQDIDTPSEPTSHNDPDGEQKRLQIQHAQTRPS